MDSNSKQSITFIKTICLHASMEKIYFTVKEAEAVLPNIEKKINRLQQLMEQSELLESVVLDYEDYYASIVSGVKKQKEMSVLQMEFYAIVNDLIEQGVVIKDIEIGLVDFFSIHEEREIFLCWQKGENHIRFWHELSGGFTGRKPIALLSKH